MSQENGDLVLLCYSENPLCVKVVEIDEAIPEHYSFEVNQGRGTWSFMRSDSSSCKQKIERPVGKAFIESIHWLRKSNMPIGVFDRSNIEHLSALGSAASSAVQDRSSGSYDSL